MVRLLRVWLRATRSSLDGGGDLKLIQLMGGFFVRVFSMTGFAGMSAVVAGGRTMAMMVKSVNHRHLDLQVRVPMGLDALEPGIRKAVKAAVRRGHVELTCTLEKETQTLALEWNETLVAAHVMAFRRAAERFGVSQEPDLNGILRLPGVLSSSSVSVDASEMEAPALKAVEELLEKFNASRALEGESLASELRAGMERLAALTVEARELRLGVSAAEFLKLTARLKALLDTEGISDDRLLAEAALLATRSDVEEELVRLKTHVERFLELLNAGGELGRQLDFLLQEMNREANTLMSKTGANSGDHGLRLTEVGLQMKVELERAREQVQNLE
jgi:uncharacterized protein (TIGR00255 family)